MFEKLKEMNVRQLASCCNLLYFGGAMVLVLGIILSALLGSGLIKWIMIILGICAMGFAYWFCLDSVRCPECREYLGTNNRMVAKVPDFCPHCGTPL